MHCTEIVIICSQMAKSNRAQISASHYKEALSCRIHSSLAAVLQAQTML